MPELSHRGTGTGLYRGYKSSPGVGKPGTLLAGCALPIVLGARKRRIPLKTNRSASRRKLSAPMLSIAIVFFIILFPILIPATVEAVGAINDARRRRRRRIANYVS
ncbi:hypothetical protein [Mycobacterium simulans]|uniref:hypothetical protein n=1 Tax=Mycobacterium simulans TaxID=627089 RepID=UPI00174DDD6B|nr:hypothetical protein [Mycobacterium simulans]